MTGEPDSIPGRRPPTIELKATEVENPASPENTATRATGEPGAPNEESSPSHSAEQPPDQAAAAPRPNGSSGGRSTSHAVSGAVGAMIMAAILAAVVAGLWFAGFLPSRESATPPADTVASNATTSAATAPPASVNADIAARLDKIEHTIQAQRPEPALGNRLAAAEAENKSLSDSLAALNRRVDDIAAASQSAAKQADAATAAADAAKSADQTNVQHGDLDALANRVAALESAVKTLSDDEAHRAANAEDQAARLTIAAAALRTAVESGAPYQAEVAAVQSLNVDQNTTAPLEPFAAGGLPSAGALGRELAALTPALQRAANPTPSETTFLDKLEANAQQLVRITPVDAPSGNDPSAVVTRIAIDAAHADLAAALTDIAALPDTAKPLTADWVKKAQARDAAVAASRQIAAAALAALAKPAAQ